MRASASSTRPVDLGAIAQGFPLLGRFQDGGPYGSGHINDTFAVIFDQAGTLVRYIFQRINHRIFKDVAALMDNIQRVTAHGATKALVAGGADMSRRVLTLVPARDGRPFHQDPHGSYWRCYLFIEKARTYDVIENSKQAYEAARAFGAFQQMLVDLPGNRLHETIPFFHHTRRRFEALRAAVDADLHGRKHTAEAEIEHALKRERIVDVLTGLQARGEIPERVTHNDTKLNNVMLDEATHEVICVIDLDTVMPGLVPYDFGDMVRSATNAAAEDERDLTKVSMRMPIYEALVAGYLSSAGRFLNQAERAHLAFSGKLITFEIGLRFLTDYLEGDAYFKTKRPGHNLDRARNQFALMRSIETQESAMQAAVERLPRTERP